MNNSMATYLSTLVGAGPTLLVYIGGIIAALIYWGRAPKPCALVLAGTLILFFASIAMPYVQMHLLQNRTAMTASISQTLMILGFTSSIIRAIGTALLLWGAFTNRPIGVLPTGFEPIRPPEL